MGEKSIVAKASSKSPSVRTTIPEKVVKEMKVKVGDALDWEVVLEGGRRVAYVKKLE